MDRNFSNLKEAAKIYDQNLDEIIAKTNTLSNALQNNNTVKS
jgi:hypothetical protein